MVWAVRKPMVWATDRITVGGPFFVCMKKDAFSIIIPTYNSPDGLRRILRSLAKQIVEFPQTEIIVVDDGGSADLRFVNDYPNVIYHRKKNGGAASARNKGMDIAQEIGTEYIAFLDSDDEIYPNYLPTIYGDMRDGYAWVSYDWMCDGHKEWAKQTDEPLMINCAMWAYCFRADLIGNKRVPEHMVLAEDQAWLHSVLRDDVKHKHSHEIFYNYLWIPNTNSVVHRYLRGELKEVREDKPVRTFKNVFYINNINVIGGVETMFYNMARKYGKDYDITILYRQGDKGQVARLKQYVRVVRWHDGMRIKCQKAFFNINKDIIEYVDADEYYQIIHADYKAYKLAFDYNPYINKYIGVSENSCKTFREISGQDIELSYNPIVVEKPKKMLRLISPTRMTWEKGLGRMKILAEALEAAGIPYTWEVFTSDHDRIENPNFVYREPRLDIMDNIANADYLVQLSDTEGYSYSILEALCVGTPVIITDFPSAAEMQVVNGVNGFILPMDMSAIPLKEIYKGLKKFKYTPHEDRWSEILVPGKGTYEEEKNLPVKVRCKVYYFDIVLQEYQHPGDVQEVPQERADRLVELGVADYTE